MPRRSLTGLAVAASALLGTVAAAPTAWAHPMACAPRDMLVDGWRRAHDQVPAFQGVDATGQLFEIFLAPDGRWTLVISPDPMRSCVFAVGEGWRPAPIAPVGEEG